MVGTPTGGAPGAGGTGTGQKAQETASVATDEGKNVANTATEQAKSVADTAKAQVSTVSQEAKTQAQRVVGDATSELQSQVEQRVGQVAEKAKTTSEQLRALAEGRTEEAGPAADWIRQASERLEQFSTRVEDMGLEGATQEVTRFARQRPMVFLAGAATAGFLLGRTFRNASAASGGNGSGGQSLSQGQRQLPASYGTAAYSTTVGAGSPDLDLTGGVGVGTPVPGTPVSGTPGGVAGGQTNPMTSPTGEFG